MVRLNGERVPGVGRALPALALFLLLVFSPALVFAGGDPHNGDGHAATAEELAEAHAAAPAGDHTEAHEAHGGHHGPPLGERLPLWSVIPFIGILLSIALGPLLAPHLWHHHFPKVSFAWALIFAIPFLIVYRGQAFHEILHIYLVDYIPFIILLWALFTAAGGIAVSGRLPGTPLANTIAIAIGTFLASWIGTTGASMILIRPLLRMNKDRKRKAYIVIFFIFLVSNIGGSLTPLGDPPLFLGFLHGVPFFWTLHLIPMMAFVVAILLAVFFVIDTLNYRKERERLEEAAAAVSAAPFKVEGLRNLIFLGGIMAGVLVSGLWKPGISVNALGVHVPIENMLRDGTLLLMVVLSLRFTPKKMREINEFTWFPIKEVAYLFAGIFMCIVPALAILRAGENGALGFLVRAAESPADYFWIAGGLSSFLDNAPTYLTFLNTELGKFYTGMPELEAVHALIAEHAIYLKALSVGAVFMGANTYIGNAPNFMVKSIAEEAGVPMPSFFGYMLKYSIPILIPIFLLVMFVFL
ncbi:MAG: sodium:proton antiporter [Candidatus Eisenbacteria bacterium]|nr:sodium:proton antiporter [Candidatus Eisenbacteria bacterium]